MRTALKVVPLALLGVAAALLVACGDRSGLLSGDQAGSLQDALAAAQSACADGQEPRAELAAQRFAERVEALPPGSVDRRLIANLREGAATLASLVPQTCTSTTDTTTTPTTVTTTTTPTTTTTTPTEPTTPTTPPTTPTEPTTPTPPPTTPTTPPDTGGGTDSGGAGSGGAGSGGATVPPEGTP